MDISSVEKSEFTRFPNVSEALDMKHHCACNPPVMPNPGFTNSNRRQESTRAKGNKGANNVNTKRTIRPSSAECRRAIAVHFEETQVATSGVSEYTHTHTYCFIPVCFICLFISRVYSFFLFVFV